VSKSNELTRVWDPLVRLLHWTLVLLVAVAWYTGGMAGPVHEWLGYGAATVVAMRLVWGVAGGPYARFAQFVRGPRETASYLRAVLGGRAPRHLGHNPLGGWMVVALLATVGSLALTGWLYTTDWLWGYAWLEQLHAALGWLLLGLVALHVCGTVATGVKHQENLVAAMFSGAKRAARGDDVA
jgi:cytochrome b